MDAAALRSVGEDRQLPGWGVSGLRGTPRSSVGGQKAVPAEGIETEFEAETSAAGLDPCETHTPYRVRGRLWAGWHHHIATRLLAGAFLRSLQQDWGKRCLRSTRPQVYRVVRELMPKERFGPEGLPLWLLDGQQRNGRARLSHEKRRAAHQAITGSPP